MCFDKQAVSACSNWLLSIVLVIASGFDIEPPFGISRRTTTLRLANESRAVEFDKIYANGLSVARDETTAQEGLVEIYDTAKGIEPHWGAPSGAVDSRCGSSVRGAPGTLTPWWPTTVPVSGSTAVKPASASMRQTGFPAIVVSSGEL